MEVGVVGKPNVGKSTFFNALTLLDVPMAPYPFTTIEPNRGIAAVRAPCPHPEKGTACTPGNAKCVDGTRWVPVALVDVPGLVPGAHEGKGLGHRFLDDLRAADGFVQVVDLSGATDAEGRTVAPGSHDPSTEVGWLEEELVAWVAEILGREFERQARSVELDGLKTEDFLAERLTGLAIGVPSIQAALRTSPVDRAHPARWTPARTGRAGPRAPPRGEAAAGRGEQVRPFGQGGRGLARGGDRAHTLYSHGRRRRTHAPACGSRGTGRLQARGRHLHRSRPWEAIEGAIGRSRGDTAHPDHVGIDRCAAGSRVDGVRAPATDRGLPGRGRGPMDRQSGPGPPGCVPGPRGNPGPSRRVQGTLRPGGAFHPGHRRPHPPRPRGRPSGRTELGDTDRGT